MPRRYWLPIIAVVGLVLSAVAYSQDTAEAQGGQPSTTKAQSDPRNQQQPSVSPALQDSLNRIGTALEAANNKQTPADETERSKQALSAQLRMADDADAMFHVGLAETIITFIGVMLVLGTLIYTRDAAREARRTADAATSTVTEAKLTTAAAVRQANAAEESAAQAKLAAAEAKRQADVTERAQATLERPHLFIEAPRLDRQTLIRFNPQIPTLWGGGPPNFVAHYDIFNYGRSPGIIVERTAVVIITEKLPPSPEINENDIRRDAVVVPADGSRTDWQAQFRGTLTDEMIADLKLHRSNAGEGGRQAFLFVRLLYQGVWGKTDEVANIWEYLIDTAVWVPRQIENYSYRRLGD